MTSNWVTFAQILASAGSDLPSGERGLQRYIKKQGWRENKECCQRRAKKAGGDVFHVSLLPGAVQLRLAGAQAANENSSKSDEPTDREQLWAAYERLSKHQKTEAQARLGFITAVDELIATGIGKKAAVAMVVAKRGGSVSTHRNWVLMVKGLPRADWLAGLAPQYNSAPPERTCHAKIWSVIKTDYLRPEKPTLASCYRRAEKLAKAQGWFPLPSLRTLRRYFDRDIPKAVQIMAREKGDISKQLYPAMKRTVGHLHAMQIVNIDGHKFDVFADFGKKKPSRPMMVAIQDIYSRKFLAFRISDSENKETVRLCIGDMIEEHGIPQVLVSDNGRAFASKWITGRAKYRHRFKIKDEEPTGLLTSMGIKTTFATPYHGQAKPIERAFRDLADTISRHPALAGAWTGNNIENAPDNRGKRAIPIEEFKALVAMGIADHNAQVGRNTETAKGISFDQCFEASMALPTTLVQMPTAAQRRLWMLAAEQIKPKRGNGAITLFGTEYWHPQLMQHLGVKLTIRFDPEDLNKPVHVYNPNDEYLFDAEPTMVAAFNDVTAARDKARLARDFNKTLKDHHELKDRMTLSELASIQPNTPPKATPPAPKKVRRMASGGARPVPIPVPQEDEPVTNSKPEKFQRSFSAAVALMDDEEKVLPFKRRSKD